MDSVILQVWGTTASVAHTQLSRQRTLEAPHLRIVSGSGGCDHLPTLRTGLVALLHQVSGSIFLEAKVLPLLYALGAPSKHATPAPSPAVIADSQPILRDDRVSTVTIDGDGPRGVDANLGQQLGTLLSVASDPLDAVRRQSMSLENDRVVACE